MLDFSFIHIYSCASIDSRAVAREIAKVFPICKIDVRPPFEYDGRAENARISDTKQQFEKQPKRVDSTMPLYDGFWLQRILAETIPAAESSHVHIIFTDLLACTFSEEDWRYHSHDSHLRHAFDNFHDRHRGRPGKAKGVLPCTIWRHG